MKKDKRDGVPGDFDELRPDYDLKALRVRRLGPARTHWGTIVRLDDEVAAAFPDAADAVNTALRSLMTRPSQRAREC